ncbi:MAG: hypothetical protein KatS3mg068_0252 [Candidatus Sericytochromatia bacterium]|nr:MAG: hypothetical protein KatS3mg068_0252 [Candidatus Sericytochromatia bacterium]
MQENISKRLIGIFDPNSFSFRASIEGLLDALNPEIKYKGEIVKITHRRIVSRPYDVLHAECPYDFILNRGAHWNPHHNSYFTIIMPETYLVNDMISFKTIDKNTSYGQMYKLGLHIPKTIAIPQEDYSDLLESSKIEPDLIFPEHELFDLKELGEEVGLSSIFKTSIWWRMGWCRKSK